MRSPLNDRVYAIGYIKDSLRGWAAENLDDGAAVFGRVSISNMTDNVLLLWDQRMADDSRPRNKRTELDHAIGDVITMQFIDV